MINCVDYNRCLLVALLQKYLILTLPLFCLFLAACGGGEENSAISGVMIDPTQSLIVSENSDSVSINIKLMSQPTDTVDISYTSSDLTEGTVSPEKITFDPSNWNIDQIILVTGVNDDIADGNQEFKLVANTIESNDINYLNLLPEEINLTNSDNDVAGFTINVSSSIVNEFGDHSIIEYQVSPNTQPQSSISLEIKSQDITEVLLRHANEIPSETIEMAFDDTDWGMPKTFQVVGQRDNSVDGNQTISLQFVSKSSDDANYNELVVNDIVLIVADSDIAAVTVNATDNLITTEIGGQTSFSVLLNSQPSDDVLLNLISSNEAEGIIDKSILTFTAENYSVPQIVTVTGIDDDISDGTQNYTIQIQTNSNDSAFNALSPASVTIKNIDDEQGIVIDPVSGLTTSESGSTIQFSIRLTKQPTENVSLNVQSNNPIEGLIMGGNSPGTPTNSLDLTYTSEDWRTPQTITVVGQDDSVSDGNQSFTVLIAEAVSNDPFYNGINPEDISVINIDDEISEITLIHENVLVTSENGDTAMFSVLLNSKPEADVELNIKSSDTTEGLVSGGSSLNVSSEQINIHFTQNDWQTLQNITIVGQDDSEFDGDQRFDIEIAVANTLDENYYIVNSKSISVLSTDNEDPFELNQGTLENPLELDFNNNMFPFSGSVGPNHSFYKIVGLEKNSHYVVTLTELSNGKDPTYQVFSNSFGGSSCNSQNSILLIGCISISNESGELLLKVNSTELSSAVQYDILIDPYTGPIHEGSPGLPVELVVTDSNLQYSGSALGRSSYYKISNLSVGKNYTINVKNLENVVQMLIYDKPNFQGHHAGLECNQVYSGICFASSDENGNLWIEISPESRNVGITFDLEVGIYSGPESQGSKTSPLALALNNSELIYAGSASPAGSFYKISNISSNTDYSIRLSNPLNNLHFIVYDEDYKIKICEKHINEYSKNRCKITSDETGFLWLYVEDDSHLYSGSTFSINIKPFFEYPVEGSPDLPKVITGEFSGVAHAGSVSRDESYYKIIGLMPESYYTVNLKNMITNNIISLSVIPYERGDIECSFSKVVTEQNVCLGVSSIEGNLNIVVGDVSTLEGTTYDLSITHFPGTLSEGLIDVPVQLELVEDTLQYSGSAGARKSYYKITNLNVNTQYQIHIKELSDGAHLFIDGGTCSSFIALDDKTCIGDSDALGAMTFQVDASSSFSGSTYQLIIEAYSSPAN